jgi:uncharacterized protein with von Willebrand factor type A (vWA) domain
MSFFTNRFRYSEWDGTQETSDVDASEVLSSLSDDLMNYGDLRHAIRSLLQRGMPQSEDGERVRGLRELLQQLRQQRRERLEQFDLGGIMDDVRERLREVMDLERSAIDDMREGRMRPPQNQDGEGDGSEQSEAGEGSQDSQNGSEGGGEQGEMTSGGQSSGGAGEGGDFLKSLMGNIGRNLADEKEEFLQELPKDPGGQVRALQDYEFLSPDAKQKFDELLDQLKRGMAQSFFKDIEKMIRDMSAGDLERMKEMVKALNEMLVKRIAGEDPGFEDFMQKFGDMFGPNPPQSLDELLEQMQQQMAAMQSLMASLPSSQRDILQTLLADKLGDPELERELRMLSKELQYLNPGTAYPFRGDQPVDLQAAMELMREMQDLDSLEQQLRQAHMDADLSGIDTDKLKELLGEDAEQDLEQIKQLMKALEEAGFIRKEKDEWELTPRGTRIIGHKALGELYQQLKKHALGNHAVPEEGRFGERLETTKPYEYGDPFHLNMSRTIRNALEREGPKTPVQLEPDDFEIYRSELITETATVMMVDLSWSMERRGAFPAAKRVALALHSLISSMYPKDSLYLIGFSAYARELKAHELPYLQWDDYVLGTNVQHALLLAEKLLAKHQGATKQVIMITDGEPTSHLENGEAMFAYPPSPITIAETLKAVMRCTRKSITINTFMLDTSFYLREFVGQMAKINGGRVFYTTPEQLGEYILVDYVQHKRRRIGRGTTN